MNRQADHILFEQFKKGDEKAFEAIFRAYYPSLCQYATQLLKEPSEAEEIVQELFVKLWERSKDIRIESSVRSYLYSAVKNYSLNRLRHIKVKNEYLQHIQSEQTVFSEENADSFSELMQKIEESISFLPPKRREIFRLSRQEGLKYREIAARLNVSVKTVETQMGIAIRTLREKLKGSLPVF